jgi:hypothetical protein
MWLNNFKREYKNVIKYEEVVEIKIWIKNIRLIQYLCFNNKK